LPIVRDHDGILLKIEGDSFLIIFKRPDRALRSAIAMQHACQRLNVGRPPEEQVLLCVGLGYGEVLRIGDEDVWGAEVNAASKLGEDTAKANEILVTGAFRDGLTRTDELQFEELQDVIPGTKLSFRVSYPQQG
jgi:adenylate cyclase